MPPIPKMEEECGPIHVQIPLLDMASAELEKMRLDDDANKLHNFPPACMTLLKSLDGNNRCIDCGEHGPQWAALSYGALLCLQCSGKHRSLGVQVSCVRSITMDNWSQQQVLAMLEGGNGQIKDFFRRHKLGVDDNAIAENSRGLITKDNISLMRYKTKAALFYRQQLAMHVQQVMKAGVYQGRAASRRLRHRELRERNSAVL